MPQVPLMHHGGLLPLRPSRLFTQGQQKDLGLMKRRRRRKVTSPQLYLNPMTPRMIQHSQSAMWQKHHSPRMCFELSFHLNDNVSVDKYLCVNTLLVKLTLWMSIMPFVSNSDTSSTGYKDSKYIVFEKNLMELFETCPHCRRLSDVRTYRRGTFLAIHQKCHHCQFSRQWKSQPAIGSSPVGNILLSAAIYFTGSSFFKVQKV